VLNEKLWCRLQAQGATPSTAPEAEGTLRNSFITTILLFFISRGVSPSFIKSFVVIAISLYRFLSPLMLLAGSRIIPYLRLNLVVAEAPIQLRRRGDNALHTLLWEPP